MPWFEQAAAVLLSEDCLADDDEAKEIYEDFNPGEAFRGQPDTTFAMV